MNAQYIFLGIRSVDQSVVVTKYFSGQRKLLDIWIVLFVGLLIYMIRI